MSLLLSGFLNFVPLLTKNQSFFPLLFVSCLGVFQLEQKQNFYLCKNGVYRSTQDIYDWIIFPECLQINIQLVCEARPCLREFSEKFLDVATTEVNFANTLSYAKLFCETDSIKRKSGSGKPTKRTPELLKMWDKQWMMTSMRFYKDSYNKWTYHTAHDRKS